MILQQVEWRSKLTKSLLLAHQEKPMTLEEENRVKNIFIQRFQREVKADLQPVAYPEYKAYLMRFVNSMDPRDLEA